MQTINEENFASSGSQNGHDAGLITRCPDLPGMWVIRNKEGNPIPGCSGSFRGTGSGSPAAEKRYKDWSYRKSHEKPVEEIV
jgi:hypothetical protein